MPEPPASIADKCEGDEKWIRLREKKSEARVRYAHSGEAREWLAAMKAGKGGAPDWDDPVEAALPMKQICHVWEDDE